ncbi:ImmA/IrrE family metallo-endopeptidase [Aurantiacibacter sp. D1-12]|uniref:ImmA/IrrE family metallo-endopeptidase n=1 Tax=Aurantiacibacter sp. D1-12 TaxID=2993658 RepID=UPI00237C67C6|nr:ImmA/IrrE family metallo-endopeptidase [Aurantiacibacter sp. D1-12]MDE1468328.1 ImmA/IrrE family metallo-endopeptidase [Aurantiacibacter sp. D1-12]
MKHGFKAQANRIALEMRREFGLAPEAPMCPFILCEHFEIRVLPLSQFSDEAAYFLSEGSSAFSAVTVQRGINRAIVHNDSHSVVRQHSNLMHELAHAFLGHPPCEAFDEDGERVYSSDIEQEANFLAGCLKVTNEAAWHIVKNGLQSTAPEIYKVSNAMLNWRLQVSGANIRAMRSKSKRRAS